MVGVPLGEFGADGETLGVGVLVPVGLQSTTTVILPSLPVERAAPPPTSVVELTAEIRRLPPPRWSQLKITPPSGK